LGQKYDGANPPKKKIFFLFILISTVMS